MFESVDARFSAVLRELDESHRFVQRSAESTSTRPSSRGRNHRNRRSISAQALHAPRAEPPQRQVPQLRAAAPLVPHEPPGPPRVAEGRAALAHGARGERAAPVRLEPIHLESYPHSAVAPRPRARRAEPREQRARQVPGAVRELPRARPVRGFRLGRTRVIQRRFNVSVPRARVPEKAATRRDRSER